MKFILNAATKVQSDTAAAPVKNAISILKRDMAKRLDAQGSVTNAIILKENPSAKPETFTVEVSEDITLSAGDDLGFVYGLLYISEAFLGIEPFWFWMDQDIKPTDSVEIDYGTYTSPEPIVKYRGWFFNDEVLIMKWNIGGDAVEPWRMAFEALLRCGGNMTIPGTDKNSRKYRRIAADMGLWITHHHAEPLGAEMFVRAYPDIQPNYTQHPDLFFKLWEDAVKEQKDYRVIWNVGFRGQGDCPFWSNDNSGQFDTPQKRGKLISDLIEKQCDLVRAHVKNPVFCTNLYGEVMELYHEGHITLPEDIIKISADNGYGKMVTRRRDNHCVRISSLPDGDGGRKGIYYHVSFYDLQAANHITMLPNSVDFVDKELSEVIKKNATEYWIVNCSNVRPHAYYLDAVRKKWYGQSVSDVKQSKEFSEEYYGADAGVAACLKAYPDVMTSYGSEEDEHAGEQFYTENVRMLANQFIKDRTKNTARLYWLTGDVPLSAQVEAFCGICRRAKAGMDAYYQQCRETSETLSGTAKRLFDATILLQATIHHCCTDGVLLFGEGYHAFEEEEYKKSFMSLGDSAQAFDAAEDAMRSAEYGVWNNFYQNDCFADVKHTAYMVKKMMGVVREFGDNSRHDKWYREAVYAPEDRQVMTLLVNDNHMTDWELFEAFQTMESEQ
jgi:hypothetical protein